MLLLPSLCRASLTTVLCLETATVLEDDMKPGPAPPPDYPLPLSRLLLIPWAWLRMEGIPSYRSTLSKREPAKATRASPSH